MLIKLVALGFCLLLSSLALAQRNEINIIPKPASIEPFAESFRINASTVIVPGANRAEADRLRDLIASRYALSLKIIAPLNFSAPEPDNAIFLAKRNRDVEITRPEGYVLRVRAKSIAIEGADAAGNSNGFRSLIQLLPTEGAKEISIPGVSIADWPRFSYRGMHLDTARHFMPVSFVKKYIDLMSQYKFNQFHWHLTDDQGWRIEIKKYPKLTEIGSKRLESHEGVYSTVF
jgi:hexosaminidase